MCKKPWIIRLNVKRGTKTKHIIDMKINGAELPGTYCTHRYA